MKKFVILLNLAAFMVAMLISFQSPAQMPETWYSKSTLYVFNPGTGSEIKTTKDCFTEMSYDGDAIFIENCDLDRFKFVLTSIPKAQEDFYSFWVYEPSSGAKWSINFYPDDLSITLCSADKSLVIIYY